MILDRVSRLPVVAFAFLLGFVSADAQTIWDADDGTLSFTKSDFADPTDPANWDEITPGVAITRGNSQGIFNPVLESGYGGSSPAGTAWAFSGSNGNPSFAFGEGAATFDQLNFSSWTSAHGNAPPSTVAVPAVVHLISEDIYLDLQFTGWTSRGSGGGFSYVRAIPEPASCALLLAGLLFFTRRR